MRGLVSILAAFAITTPGLAGGLPAESTSAPRRMMEHGAEQVALGKKLVQSSTRHIQLGSQLTRKANRIRFLARKQGDTTGEFQTIASDLGTVGSDLKSQGAALRSSGEQLKARGVEAMRTGFFALRNLDPQSVQPISLSRRAPGHSDGALGKAHNAAFRTIKSSRQEAQSVQASKSLVVGQLNPTQKIPDGLDFSPLQLSAQGQYFARISSGSEGVALNRIHDWHLDLMDLKGEPVSGAKIVVEGTMPGHVHGMPTKPRITAEREAGRYVVGGMKFQMKGWWVITFIVDKDRQLPDRITYNILL